MEGGERRRRHAGEEGGRHSREGLPHRPRTLGLPERDGRPAGGEERHHQRHDEPEDHQAVDPRMAVEPAHPRRHEEEPAGDRIDDRQDDQEGEEVLQPEERGVERPSHPGERRARMDPHGEHLEGADREDDEAPEDEEVHEARDRFLEQLLVAEDEAGDPGQPFPGLIGARERLFRQVHDADEAPRMKQEEAERGDQEDGHDQARDVHAVALRSGRGRRLRRGDDPVRSR